MKAKYCLSRICGVALVFPTTSSCAAWYNSKQLLMVVGTNVLHPYENSTSVTRATLCCTLLNRNAIFNQEGENIYYVENNMVATPYTLPSNNLGANSTIASIAVMQVKTDTTARVNPSTLVATCQQPLQERCWVPTWKSVMYLCSAVLCRAAVA